jgi:hypothetical protein
MRDWSLTDDPSYSVYLPTYGQTMSPANYVVHLSLPSATLLPLLRARLAELDRALPISDVQTLDEVVGASVASRRFTMLLLAALAAVALVMALAGVYGVLSYAVSQRRSEVGVRMALGASNRSVLRLIVAQGMRPVVIGPVIGTAGALWLSRDVDAALRPDRGRLADIHRGCDAPRGRRRTSVLCACARGDAGGRHGHVTRVADPAGIGGWQGG